MGARFCVPVQTGPGTHPASYVIGFFPGVKRSVRGVNHSLPSSAEVKERVELYLYSHSRSSWPVVGRTFRARPVCVLLPTAGQRELLITCQLVVVSVPPYLTTGVATATSWSCCWLYLLAAGDRDLWDGA